MSATGYLNKKMLQITRHSKKNKVYYLYKPNYRFLKVHQASEDGQLV